MIGEPCTPQAERPIAAGTWPINCGRRLVRGWFPFNPIAAEFGSNFDVLVTFNADTPEIEEQLADGIRQSYHCRIEIDTRTNQHGALSAL